MRLRDFPSGRHTWRDLWVFVTYSERDSNLFRARFPGQADWTMTNRLLALAVNALRILVWFKTKDGQKGRRRPEMIGPDVPQDDRRAGSKPKPTPLSKLKHALGRGENDDDKSRTAKIRNLFR